MIKGEMVTRVKPNKLTRRQEYRHNFKSLNPPHIWSPLEITNLKAWFEAGLGVFKDQAMTIPATATNDHIRGWQDQSGNGNHLTQPTESQGPTLQLAALNGRNFLTFTTAASQVLDSADLSPALTQPTTAWIVWKPIDISTYGFALDATTTSKRNTFLRNPADVWDAYAGVELKNITSDTNWNMHLILFNTTNSWIRMNGTTIDTGNVGTMQLGQIRVGADSNSIRYLWGSIAEIGIVNAELDATTIDKLEAYLQAKYGL